MSETKPPVPALRHSQPITKVRTLQELFDHPGLKERMAAIAPRHLNPDRLLRTLINAGLKTPNLNKVHPLSMLGVAMTLSYLGLEPNTPLQQVHVIPFDVTRYVGRGKPREYVRTDANLIIGYPGYIELIARGQHVKDVDCDVIWAGDEMVDERGSNKKFRHVPKYLPRADDAEPAFAYMFARMVNGGEHAEVLSAADVHHARASSQGFRAAMSAHDKAISESKNPRHNPVYSEAPWIKFPIPMWKKTALRQGQKWLPKSAELGTAISLDEAGDEGRVDFSKVIEGEAVSEGAWEIPADQVETDDEPDYGRPAVTPPTQVQVKTPDVPAAPRPAPDKPAATRKAPAKTAAPAPNDEPPAGWDENSPPDTGPANPPAAQTSVPATAPESAPGGTAGNPAPEVRRNEPASGAQAFEAWLLDWNGDPVTDEPYTDPMTFVVALSGLISDTPGMRVTLLEQNADGIQDAMVTGDVAAQNVLIGLGRVAEPEREEELPGEASALVIQMKFDRGKPLLAPYLKDFKAYMPEVSTANWDNFLDLNRSEMAKAPPSTGSLVLKALVERAKAIGTTVPPELGQMLLGQGKGAAASVPGAAPVADGQDPDERAADNLISDIDRCATVFDLEQFNNGMAVKSFATRVTREGKPELVEKVRQAYLAKAQVLRAAQPATAQPQSR